MDVLQAIHTKRAVRKFLPKQLKNDEIRAILSAGRRAQSSKNSQPWHFIAVQERAILGFPEEWHVRIILSFGYPANPSMLTRPNRRGGRRRIEDIVHRETW